MENLKILGRLKEAFTLINDCISENVCTPEQLMNLMSEDLKDNLGFYLYTDSANKDVMTEEQSKGQDNNEQ